VDGIWAAFLLFQCNPSDGCQSAGCHSAGQAVVAARLLVWRAVTCQPFQRESYVDVWPRASTDCKDRLGGESLRAFPLQTIIMLWSFALAEKAAHDPQVPANGLSLRERSIVS